MNETVETTRESILNKYGADKINKCWELFCKQIVKNYQTGKASTLKSFGTFTFTDAEVNLEGTTNQSARDLKPRKPVFIVSPEFVEHLKPGIHTDKNGVVYYNQKKTNNVPMVRANFAEIAFTLSLSKEEVSTILNHLINFLGDSIRRGELKNKEMPDLGTLTLRNNIIAVKFNEDLIKGVKLMPQKLIDTKKKVNLFMESNTKFHESSKPGNTLPNLATTLNKLRPNTAVVTRVTREGEAWLKENLDIDLNEVEEEKIEFKGDDFNDGTQFINDVRLHRVVKPKKFSELSISKDILDEIYFKKAIILSNMKSEDRKNSGMITKLQFEESFKRAEIEGLTDEIISNIFHLLATQGRETILYLKAFATMIKDIKTILHVQEEYKSHSTSRPHSSRPMQMTGSNTQGNSIYNQRTRLDEVEAEIKSIKLIFEQIKRKNSTRLDQYIGLSEFAHILRDFNIIIPSNKLTKILNYIELSSNFTLSQFQTALDKCKILSNEMKFSDIIEAFRKLKDMAYVLGGRVYIFGEKTSINKEHFIKLFLNKATFSSQVLGSIYDYIVKTDRDLTLRDYSDNFEKNKTNPDENFFQKVKERLIQTMHQKHFKYDEYFDHLIAYNVNRNQNVLTRIDLHSAFLKEKLPFSAEEVDWIFDHFDKKKDGVIDRQEFVQSVKAVTDPLFKIKDLIKKNNLEIEDLLYRMQIDPNVNERYDMWKFKAKIKLLDSTLDNELIASLFNEMQSADGYVDSRTIVTQFNVFKREHFRNINTDSFKANFISEIRTSANFTELKNLLEKLDTYNNGLVSKVEFCSVIQQFLKEFKDEDIMKFLRVTSMFSTDNKVKYPEFLNLIYYNSKADKFTECVDEIKKFLSENCKGDINIFYVKMNNVSNGHALQKYVTIDKLYEFLRCRVEMLNEKVVCKFDVDQDGRVSMEDLKAILDRYSNTSYFRYENSQDKLEVNLYAKDILSREKFKEIVKDIKAHMKSKNLTTVGLFNKMDTNKDGFVSHPEFNINIDKVIKLSQAIKDQFFNYLDVYSLGMVDLETFLKRFKEFESSEIIVKNNTETEDLIMSEFQKWIKRNKHLSDTEIFSAIDYDTDGVIDLDNFKSFLIDKLNFSRNDLNDYKIERVMQRISITKNKNIGLADIKELQRRLSLGEGHVDLKETFGQIAVQNQKNDISWVNEAIVKLGLYISEKFGSVAKFIHGITYSDKLKLEDFIKFCKTHHTCFDGFNLTNDEILLLYTSLDSHKKNYLSTEDLESKLSLFEFFKKMHQDIKTFIKENFPFAADAFKYLKNQQEDLTHLTRKELFNGINSFFPNKYTTPAILKYIDTNFKEESISFSEFNYIYYDEFKQNEEFIKERLKSSKLTMNRSQTAIGTNSSRPFSSRAAISSSHPKLSTPFDSDALEKVKRIIHSSRFDFTNFFRMHEVLSDGGYMNQFEFRNMLKKLNLGMTSLEIDEIIARAGKTRDGKINLREFIKYVSTEDSNLVQARKNLSSLIGDIKQLIYKYYNNPKMAFQFNDKNISHQMDFEKYKMIISSLYERECRPVPNFTQLKNTFDLIDLRKDGLIDMSEWLKAMSMAESTLDFKAPQQMKILREWETSKGISDIYRLIAKNKKLIKEKASQMLFNQGQNLAIHSDNLITVLKEMFNDIKMSNTQWKILVSIADKERNSLVDFNLFIRLVEGSAQLATSHPRTRFY